MLIHAARVVVVAWLAAHAALVAFGDVTDYGTNFAFMRHSMPTEIMFPDSTIARDLEPGASPRLWAQRSVQMSLRKPTKAYKCGPTRRAQDSRHWGELIRNPVRVRTQSCARISATGSRASRRKTPVPAAWQMPHRTVRAPCCRSSRNMAVVNWDEVAVVLHFVQPVGACEHLVRFDWQRKRVQDSVRKRSVNQSTYLA